MRILLTGGTGYIGQYTRKFLKDNGHDVVITSRRIDGIVDGYPNKYLELLDTSSITNICKGFDVVIHMANLNELLVAEQPREALLANSYATRTLYLDATECNVKYFVYLSTFHVYGLDNGIIDESTKVNPRTDYALTHFFAEQYIKQLSVHSNCKVSIVRLTNGIGLPLNNIDKWYLVLNDFCKMAFLENRITMKSNGLPIRDFIAMKDVAKGILFIINHMQEQGDKYDVYNLSSQTVYNMRDLAYMVKECFHQKYNRDIELILPDVTEDQKRAIKPLLVNSNKLRKLGWIPEIKITDVIEEIFNGLELAMFKK